MVIAVVLWMRNTFFSKYDALAIMFSRAIRAKGGTGGAWLTAVEGLSCQPAWRLCWLQPYHYSAFSHSGPC